MTGLLTQLVIETGHAAALCCNERIASYGLKPKQYDALEIVAAHPELTQRRIANMLGVDATTTIFSIILPLVEQGLVYRNGSSKKGRGYAYRLSSKGEGIISKIRHDLSDIEFRVSFLDPIQLASALDKLKSNLSSDIEEQPRGRFVGSGSNFDMN